TAALADSFAFQTKVLDSVDNGILSFDQAGKITLINRAARKLLGLSKQPAEINVLDCLPQLPIQQVLESGNRHYLEGELHLGDGTGRIVY
ncbi:PAS domain-containing protein, partial [Pseudomonas sp. SIMBA_065]